MSRAVMQQALNAWATDLEQGREVWIPASSLRKIAEALAQPDVGWPCEIVQADFEESTVTLQMQSADFKVSAGVYWLHTAPPAPQCQPLTPDMFWNQDDPERPHDSIEGLLNEEICNGYLEVGAVFTILQAKKFPSLQIKVTSIDEDECEAEYEIIEAAHGIGAKP